MRIFGGRVAAIAGVEIIREDQLREVTSSFQITLLVPDTVTRF
ncbi:hypothetical protein AM1_A0216 (plasmid) [Acaryochloris marina MBIC11017]|uniref:Uncharacterized protein n=1 Tax=Acaryochloris marina (strain MBIC 11017) TaxID=329726 RepID=A8ZKL9_ACAM1|nr:hypothetical protein AM1_A0216 [Acaryochloris marina MBIC11017]